MGPVIGEAISGWGAVQLQGRPPSEGGLVATTQNRYSLADLDVGAKAVGSTRCRHGLG